MVFWISKERNQILLVIPHIFIYLFFLSIFCELDMLEIWLHLKKKKPHVISIENFEWIQSQKLLQDVDVHEQEHNRASFEHQRIPLWGIKLTSARPTRGVSLRRSIVCRQQMCWLTLRILLFLLVGLLPVVVCFLPSNGYGLKCFSNICKLCQISD